MSVFNKIVLNVANNIKYTAVAYVLSVIIGATLFSYVEDKSWFNSVYWAITTALTVGYGEIVPATVAGKLIFIFFGHLWIVMLIPCVIANIIVRVLRNQNEFTHDEQEAIKSELHEIKMMLLLNKKGS